MAPPSGSDQNGIDLLKREHRDLDGQFERCLKARTDAEREKLWRSLIAGLEMHIAFEAEVVFPAFLDATENALTHFVASLVHESIVAQIAEVSRARPGTPEFVSRIRSLRKIFAHHARDLEKSGGMFEEGRRSSMNVANIGQIVHMRKNSSH